MKIDFDVAVHPASRAAWRRWLKANHNRAEIAWLIYDKNPNRNLTYAEAVEEALCFGWIDGIAKPIDERQYAQRFTPRKNTGNWSAVNRERFARLEEKRLMTKAGRDVGPRGPVVERWRDGDPLPALLKPLRKKLEALSRAQRENYVRYVIEAKQEETRKKRLKELRGRL